MITDITARYHGGNAESVAAHALIADRAPTIQRRILGHVRACGPVGATVDEIEVALGFKHQTASARVSELKAVGILVANGTRRPTRSGASASVLVVGL